MRILVSVAFAALMAGPAAADLIKVDDQNEFFAIGHSVAAPAAAELPSPTRHNSALRAKLCAVSLYHGSPVASPELASSRPDTLTTKSVT